MDCLQHIIGLAENGCICFPQSPNVSSNNQSVSNLFIASSDSIPLKWADVGADCGSGVWDVLQQAKEYGIKKTLGAFYDKLFKKYKSAQRPFKEIGSLYGKSFQINKGGWVGLSIKPKLIKGAKHILSGVQLNFKKITPNTVVEVRVYRANDLNTPLGTTNVTVQGSQSWHSANFPNPIVFPQQEYSDYYVVYKVPNGAQPLHNKSKTGCGSCGGSSATPAPYLDSLEVGGVDTVDLQDIKHLSTQDGYGMVLNASIMCDVSDWVCDIVSNISTTVFYAPANSQASPGMALAEAIQTAARISVINTIMRTDRLNNLTIIDDKSLLNDYAEHLDHTFRNAISLLVELYPRHYNNCLACNKGNRINIKRK